MRRVSCILLILVFLFNLFGYRILLHYWQQQGTVALQAKLDREQYDPENLLEIKIPLNLPYHSNWTEFERFDGEVTVSGTHYRYVMRKIYNDSLVLLCIPNEIKNKVQAVQDQFAGLVTDLQKSPEQQKSKESNSFSPFKFAGDYIFQQTSYRSPALAALLPIYGAELVTPVISFALSCPWHPPDGAANC